jgi:hypothetical protein
VDPTDGPVCNAIINNFQLPNYCTCDAVVLNQNPSSRLGQITCRTTLPSTVAVVATALFAPCNPGFQPFFSASVWVGQMLTNVGQYLLLLLRCMTICISTHFIFCTDQLYERSNECESADIWF